jgi:DNA-binding NarL/FixJ family response regulator
MIKKSYQVAIVDDEKLFRAGLKAIIESNPQLKVCFEGSHGLEFINKLNDGLQPDIVLLDLSMPIMDGVKTLEHLNKLDIDIKVIIVSSHYDPGLIIRLIELGASSYLAKNTDPEKLDSAIINVIEKGFHYTDYIITLLRDRMKYGKQKEKISTSLTDRETQILIKLCDQKTAKEIAEELYISPRTVEGHRNNLMAKTNARNIAGLIIYAIEKGIYNVTISRFTS